MNDIIDESDYEKKELKPATVLDRLTATTIDLLLFFLVTYFVNDFFFKEEYGDFLYSRLLTFFLLIFFYSVFFLSSENQATLGMQLVRIRVLGEDKKDIKVRRVIKRVVINWVLFINFLILSGQYKQSFADKQCRTIVIKN